MVKGSKSRSSNSSQGGKFSNPFTRTPVKKLFNSLRSSNITTLGKRRRDGLEPSYDEFDYGELDPVIDTPPSIQRAVLPPPKRSGHRRNQAISSSQDFNNAYSRVYGALSPPSRMALANEDAAENAVVITALDELPFCCHADLLIMNRDQLVDAAVSLNERLPRALQIQVRDTISANDIRQSIELLVGIQPPRAPPNDPRALQIIKEERDDDADHDITPSIRLPPVNFEFMDGHPTPPTSPLAHRSHSTVSLGAAFAKGSSKLAMLVEEDEREFMEQQEDRQEFSRPQKRPRLSSGDEQVKKLQPVDTLMKPFSIDQVLRPRSQNTPQPAAQGGKKSLQPRLPRSRTLGPAAINTKGMRTNSVSRIPRRAVSNPVTVAAIRKSNNVSTASRNRFENQEQSERLWFGYYVQAEFE
ncbi:hypothetical protein DL96DRAFT_1551862 [Flagelloscypha sp. PMI_526]|nr:hypothetical protein DL96DRAFT_1551862 [Flagelloscypha sp. PMI_526]